MTARNAGSAFVKIRPDAKDFVKDLKRDLAAVQAGTIDIPVSANFAQARADIKRFKESQQGSFRMPVDMALGQADADLKAFRARQQANGLTVKVDADTGKAQREIAALRRQMGGIGDLSSALRITAGAGGIAGLPAASLGLAQVAAAIQQVSQAGLALPGVFAGIGASISTLVVGLSGISDAYEAVSAAADSSARDGVQASNRMRNAVVDEASARRDVARATRDARQELQDLNVEMRGGLVNESRAILEAQKAREDLARGNFSDVRDARLRVVEADQRLLEVRSRNQAVSEKLADTNAKGIANSDQVVAANERLVRSQQAVADAAGGISAAQQKADDAMAKLSPNAQAFVNTLLGLKPVAQDLRNTISEIGLDGLSTRLEDTVNKLMPTMNSGLGEIAQGWNDNFKQLFTSIGSDSSKGLIERILGNTGDAQSRLTAAIDPLIHGVGVLTAAGTDGLPRMADALGDVAKRFDNFISEADKDGRLQKWIDEGMAAFGNLGETVINLGKTWTAITKASGGGALLSTIENLTNRLQTFLNSTEGQDKLRKFFDEGRDMLDQWRPILEALPGLFEGVYGGAKTYIGGVLEVISPLLKLLSDHPQLVATAIAAWAGWKAVGPIVGGVQSTLGGLSTMVTNLGTGFASTRDAAKKSMSEVDDAFVKAGKPSGSGLAKFSGAMSALGGASGPLMAITTAAIPALMGAIDKLNDKHAEASRIALQFEKDERTLEATLDRVTGKVTQATRDQAIATARDYKPDGPGGGIDGITKGDALAAAKSLGIAPDVYTDALVGKPEAVAQVRDVLTKNNLLPELSANAVLGQRFTDIRGATNNKLSNDDIINALLGDKTAVDKYNQAFEGTGIESRSGDYSLAAIAQMLSPTGRASVLSGGALNRSLAALPGAAAGAIDQNQANYGQWRLNPAGKDFFGGDFQVGASGSDFQVVVPDAIGIRGKLDQSGLKVVQNQDGTFTVTVPKDSPLVEKYAKGGGTPSGSGPLPGGGFPAIVHPNEWWLNPRGRAMLGDDFLSAANMGKLDIGKLPRFDDGGLVDQYGNPVTAGGMPGPAAGPITSPVAPNPTASGGVGGIFGKVLSGIQGPIGNALTLGSSLMNSMGSPADGGTGGGVDPVQGFAARASQVPGLVGLFGSMAIGDPAAQEAALTSWGTQTLGWTANWATNTLGEAGSILANGALGMVGLDNSILSSSNPWNQAGQQAASFALGSDGPIGTLMGAGSGSQSGSGSITDPASLASQYGVTVDPATGQLMTSSMAGDATLSPQFLQSLYSSGAHAAAPGKGESARDYAHRVMMPFWQNRGFTVGDHQADKYGEHQNGALDIMVPDIAAGNSVLQELLKDPNVYGVIFNNQVYGYGNGFTPSDYSAGHTGDPNQDHKNHVHVWYKPPSMDVGGPTPTSHGPVDAKGGHLAVVHPNEFMISARGRSRVPDSFLHALNRGMVDPKDLPAFFDGGPAPQGMVQPPPPKPNFEPKTITPKVIAPVPSAPGPAPRTSTNPAPVTAPSTPPPDPHASQAPYLSPQVTTPTRPGAAPSSINHNLPAVSKGISSAASAIGSAISTAMGIASMGAGAAGSPAAGAALGAASSFAAGLATQGGKVVDAAVNVLSSALVGNVPGSMGDENAPAGGWTLRPDQNRPATASYRGSRGDTNNFYGYTAQDVLRQKDNQEALKKQAMLATVRG
jgi:hypothetical protein